MKRIFLSAALALLAVGAKADPILTVSPIPTNPELGSQVVVNVEVDPGGFLIGDYLLFLSFDETILSFDGISILFGTALDGPFDSIQDVFDDGFGTVEVSEFALFFDPFTFLDEQDFSTPFSLFDITFDVIGTGFTTLFVDGFFGDDFADPINLDPISANASLEAVPVQVPEPGTLALFGIGLLGLGLTRRRTV